MTRVQAVVSFLCALAMALGAWWWLDNMERRMVAFYHVSDAARANSMLAATALLQRAHYPVAVAPTLGGLDLAHLADGTLLLAEPTGLMTPAQTAQLLAWVQRGNTLVTRPRWIGEGEQRLPQHAGGKAALGTNGVELDPIGARYSVGISDAQQQTARCEEHAAPVPLVDSKGRKLAAARLRLGCFAVAAGLRMLELDSVLNVLTSPKQAPAPVAADTKADALRIYAEGKGRIVMLATNYFDNAHLADFDHAEVLLMLARQHEGRGVVTIVQRLDVLPWYRALWQNFTLALVGVIVLVLLAAWRALRRFGPLLPSPELARRALIDHVNASGAWLWRLPGGRTLLLDAVRRTLFARLARRLPVLGALGPADQIALLARATKLAPDALDAALFQHPADHPRAFTAQIRTLQQLRNHYER